MDFIQDLFFNIKSGIKILFIITDRLSKKVILIPILLIFTPIITTVIIN